MFDSLRALPADPILGLMQLYRMDTNPNKVDLGVGVYKNDSGQTPVMRAVKMAEQQVLEHQLSKVYVGPAGNEAFIEVMKKLSFGECLPALNTRLAAIQTPGGCGALRVAAELIKTASPDASVWVSNPTWGNHMPLLGNAGLTLRQYPYLSECQTQLDWPAMQAAMEEVAHGDIVLLHASCHNPTGVDLTQEQWHWLTDKALEKGFIPFVDMAYQGFGRGVEQDAEGLRHMASQLPEMLLAVSCSKNFGLYRERVGLVAVLCPEAAKAEAAKTHMLSIVRGIYSMPPDHGAAIVAQLLSDSVLRCDWLDELESMRARIESLRSEFAAIMNVLGYSEFEFVARQKGMFSYLGISHPQVAWLAKYKSIYLLDSSRASIAGLRRDNLDYVCQSLAEALSEFD
ncbi:MAG TPA: amino acid aminotransferase [Marinagarivorans sp.]